MNHDFTNINIDW